VLEHLGAEPQNLLGTFALGDVRDHTDENVFAELVLKDRFPGQDDVLGTARVGDRFLVEVGDAPCENLFVLRDEYIGLLLREEIVIAPAQHVAAREADVIAERIVEENEAVAPVLDKDRLRNRVEDAGDKLMAVAERFLGVLPSAHVEDDADQAAAVAVACIWAGSLENEPMPARAIGVSALRLVGLLLSKPQGLPVLLDVQDGFLRRKQVVDGAADDFRAGPPHQSLERLIAAAIASV
jgi:hypothetical protein